MLIHEEDFDTECPEFGDDQSEMGPTSTQTGASSLLSTIQVARSLQSFSKLFKEPFIKDDDIRSWEGYINNSVASFPRQLSVLSHDPLDPRSLPPLIYLQNARLILYRHNLSPSSPPDLRLQAMDNCIVAARDTAHLMTRCMSSHNSTPANDWRMSLAISATTMLCTHLWRCTLLLLSRCEFTIALALIRASLAIGNSRPINMACGRYLSFYLSMLYDRLQSGSIVNFDEDEEILAYATGDLQASYDGNWIGNDQKGFTLQPRESSRSPEGIATVSPESRRSNDSNADDITQSLSEEEMSNWGGWERIENMVHYLIDIQRQHQQSSSPSLQQHLPQYTRGSSQEQQTSPDRQSIPTLPPLTRHVTSSLPPASIPRLDTDELLKLPPLQQQQQQPQQQELQSVAASSPSTNNSPSNSRMNIANII